MIHLISAIPHAYSGEAFIIPELHARSAAASRSRRGRAALDVIRAGPRAHEAVVIVVGVAYDPVVGKSLGGAGALFHRSGGGVAPYNVDPPGGALHVGWGEFKGSGGVVHPRRAHLRGRRPLPAVGHARVARRPEHLDGVQGPSAEAVPTHDVRTAVQGGASTPRPPYFHVGN